MALDLDSDKSQSFDHREELDSAVQFQFGPVIRCSWCMLYIAQGSTAAKRTHEVRPSLLVRESSRQLIMNLLEAGIFDTLHTYRFLSLRKTPPRP